MGVHATAVSAYSVRRCNMHATLYRKGGGGQKRAQHIYCRARSEVNMDCHVISARAIFTHRAQSFARFYDDDAEWLLPLQRIRAGFAHRRALDSDTAVQNTAWPAIVSG